MLSLVGNAVSVAFILNFSNFLILEETRPDSQGCHSCLVISVQDTPLPNTDRRDRGAVPQKEVHRLYFAGVLFFAFACLELRSTVRYSTQQTSKLDGSLWGPPSLSQ